MKALYLLGFGLLVLSAVLFAAGERFHALSIRTATVYGMAAGLAGILLPGVSYRAFRTPAVTEPDDTEGGED